MSADVLNGDYFFFRAFVFAHLFFCVAEIRAFAAALICRRLLRPFVAGGPRERRPITPLGGVLKNSNRAIQPLALSFQFLNDLFGIHKFRTFYT